MREIEKGLVRLLDAAAKDLAPAYFALVMATGIVSLAAQDMAIPLLPWVLFWLNGAFYGGLWFLTLWRIMRFGRLLGVDLKDYQRGPGFFSVVAGSAILGSQFVLLANEEITGILLWGLAMALCLILNYGIFTTFTIQRRKPSLEHGITGTCLLAVVAAQSPRCARRCSGCALGSRPSTRIQLHCPLPLALERHTLHLDRGAHLLSLHVLPFFG